MAVKRITFKSSLEEVAAIVCEALAKAGIDVVLTGGAVVSIYTHNEYESYDLDFITMTWAKKVDPTMESLGFMKGTGRHWIHPDNQYFVEFPGNTLEIGNSKETKPVDRKTKAGMIRLLSPTDCVKDRLAAFYHWNDRQGLDQAVLVAHRQKISLSEVEKWSKAEGNVEKFLQFKRKLE